MLQNKWSSLKNWGSKWLLTDSSLKYTTGISVGKRGYLHLERFQRFNPVIFSTKNNSHRDDLIVYS